MNKIKNFKFLFLTFTFLLILFAGCSKTEEIEEIPVEETTYRFTVFYKSDNVLYKDVGAKVFIYYNIDQMAFSGSEYKGDGLFTCEKEVLSPDLSYEIGIEGYIDVNTDYIKDSNYTSIVESGYFKGRFVSHYHLRYRVGNAMITEFL